MTGDVELSSAAPRLTTYAARFLGLWLKGVPKVRAARKLRGAPGGALVIPGSVRWGDFPPGATHLFAWLSEGDEGENFPGCASDRTQVPIADLVGLDWVWAEQLLSLSNEGRKALEGFRAAPLETVSYRAPESEIQAAKSAATVLRMRPTAFMRWAVQTVAAQVLSG